MRHALIIAGLASLLVSPFAQIHAQSAPCFDASVTAAQTARVASVPDPRTLVLDDGRKLRPAFIEWPTQAGRQSPLHLLAGQTIAFITLSAQPDRYGRLPAWLGQGRSLLQVSWLSEGQALFAPHGDSAPDSDCIKALRQSETQARDQKRGVWHSPDGPFFAIKNGDNPGSIAANLGLFTIVEGVIVSVRESQGMTYLNFGRPYFEGLAVYVTRRNRQQLEQEGFAFAPLKGQKVRVRGWVTQREDGKSGPRIALEQSAQIEIVAAASGETSSQSRPADAQGNAAAK